MSVFLNNIAKPTTAKADEFVLLAGEISNGNKMVGGLKIGQSFEQRKGMHTQIHNYIDVVPDIVIDSNYSSFYHSDGTRDERFTNLSEPLQRYNEVITENATTQEIAEQYLIHNIPKRVVELAEGYVRGEGYRAKTELCTILHQEPSKQDIGQFTAILYKGEKFAIVEGLKKDIKGDLDLRDVKTSQFRIENFQEALDVYRERSKCEILEGKANKLTPSKEVITNLTGAITSKGINQQIAGVKGIVLEPEKQQDERV